MNAVASTLPRADRVQSNVRRFGRRARVVSAVLLGFGFAGVLGIFLFLAFGPNQLTTSGNGGASALLVTPFTMYLRAAASFGFWLTVGYQLYRLFGNLAAGAIYTPENVRRVRNVSLMWLLFAVLGVALPAALDLLRQLTDGSPSTSVKQVVVLAYGSFAYILESLFSAGLVLLASWIMEVGLHEKYSADVLRRDADLTI